MPYAPATLYWVTIVIEAVAALVHWIWAPAVRVEDACAAGVDAAASDATMADATRRRFTKANPLHLGPAGHSGRGLAILAKRDIRRFRISGGHRA